MKSRKLLCGLFIVSVYAVSVQAIAANCNTEEAKGRWQKLEDSQTVYGGGMIKNTPTFSVNERAWNSASYNVRLAIVNDFACLVAGPEKRLVKARVVNKGGNLLAEWDGISGELDVK